jgi:hypothetical protein
VYVVFHDQLPHVQPLDHICESYSIGISYLDIPRAPYTPTFRHAFVPAQTTAQTAADRQFKDQKEFKKKHHATPYLQVVAERTGLDKTYERPDLHPTSQTIRRRPFRRFRPRVRENTRIAPVFPILVASYFLRDLPVSRLRAHP